VTERRVREAFVASRRGKPGGMHAEEALALAAPARTDETVILAGYLHNAWALVSLGAFLTSLAWMARSRSMIAAWKQRRAAARGVCAGCGYDLSGLATSSCPECGLSLPHRCPPRSTAG
jgi:hypothetical protein